MALYTERPGLSWSVPVAWRARCLIRTLCFWFWHLP